MKRTFVLKLCFLLLLLILKFSLSFAQRVISGRVINGDTGDPIPNITVGIKGTKKTTITNSFGIYRIEVPDTLKTIEFSGFKGMKLKEFHLLSQDRIDLILTIQISEIFSLTLQELMEVDVISASKFSESLLNTPATILIINKKDIINRGYITLPDLLSDLPGFDLAASHGNLNQLVYARGNRTGSYNERTLLMVNGIEHNILYAQNMNIAQDFPLTAIDKIEILYGPSSAIYGPNAFSGIINIITKTPDNLKVGEDKACILTGGGSFNTQFAEITYLARNEQLGLSLSYRRFRSDQFDISDRPGYFTDEESDGLKKIIGNPEIWGPYTDYYPEYQNGVDDDAIFSELTSGNFKIGYNRLVTRHGSGSEYPYDKTVPSEYWKFFRNIFYTKYFKDISDRLQWIFLSTYQNSGVSPDAIWAQGWFEHNNWDSLRTVEMLTWKFISNKWELNQDLIFRPNHNWIISGGIKYASGNYQKSYEFGRSDQTIWYPGEQWDEPDVLFPKPNSKEKMPGNTFSDTEWGCYLQSKFSIFEKKINVITGIRYDKNSIYGESFNPRIGLTYKISDKLLLKTSYGTGFQAPAPRNLYGSWGGLTVTENLDPEKIQSIDLSLHNHDGNYNQNVTFFYNEIDNSILQGVNLPDKHIFGAEYNLNFLWQSLGLFIRNVKLHLNYSFVNAEYVSQRIDTILTGRSSIKVGDIADHKFNIIFDLDVAKNIHYNLSLNYVGERETVVTNPITSVNPYFVTDMSLQWHNILKKEISIFFNINNILDVEYYHPGMDNAGAGEDLSVPSKTWYSSRLPQPGRNFNLGLRVNL